MSAAEVSRARRGGSVPRILCAGIIVLDEVFRVEEFPQADGKVQAKGYFVVNGGCAANAAVAIARLGGRAALAEHAVDSVRARFGDDAVVRGLAFDRSEEP